MKNYLRVHLVQAEPMTRGKYNKFRGWEIPTNENPDDPGYLVVYPDGYRSWCPKAAFEKQGFELRRTDRITPEDIRAFVSLGTQNAKKIGEKTTLVARRYATDIEDFDTSSCVDPANFDLELGARIAAERLDDRVWMFLGWLLAWAKNGVDRKVEAPPEEAAVPGNAAALREALEGISENLLIHIEHRRGNRVTMPISEAKFYVDYARTVLAAPARNCDVGTKEEQHKRFKEYCEVRDCHECPFSGNPDCPLDWAQTPFAPAEGGAK